MHNIYTPPATDVEMEEAEEESKPIFNPALRSVQAFPKAASSSSSLWHGSPFHQVVNIKRQGHPNIVPNYRDVTADPDEFSSNPPQSRAQSESRVSFSRDPSLAQSRATSVGSILPRSGDTTPREVLPKPRRSKYLAPSPSPSRGSSAHNARSPSRTSTIYSEGQSMMPPAPPLLPDTSIDKPAEAPQELPPQGGPSSGPMRRRQYRENGRFAREPKRRTLNPGNEEREDEAEAKQ
jgi:hypothetical protein